MIILSPAYGRNYTTQERARDDFLNNKDFIIESKGPSCGRYCDVAGLRLTHPDETIEIQFANKTKAVMVEVPV